MIRATFDNKQRIRTSIPDLLISNGAVQKQNPILIDVDRSLKVIVDSAVVRPGLRQ